MIKEVFVLKKDSWHAKLMNYIWGFKTYDFSHICPYFWLSVFNVLAIVPFFIAKSILSAILYPFNLLNYVFIESREKSRKAYLHRLIDSEHARYICVTTLSKKKFQKVLDEIFYINEKVYNELYERRTKWRNAQEGAKYSKKLVKQQIAMTNKQRINAVLKFIQPVIRLIIWFVAGALLACLAYCIYWTGLKVAASPGFFLEKLLLALAAGVISAIGIVSCYYISKWIQAVVPENFGNGIVRVLAAPFVWLGLGIVTIVSIIVQIIKNNCPAIDWK